jgi:hypothetical protein
MLKLIKIKPNDAPILKAFIKATNDGIEKFNKVVSNTPTEFDAKTTDIATLIKNSDFGCQKLNVAKLMDLITGLKVSECYCSLDKATNNPKLSLKAGTVWKTLNSGVGYVWKDDAGSLRAGIGRGDFRPEYSAKNIVQITREDIIELIKRDKSYITDYLSRFGKPVDMFGNL